MTLPAAWRGRWWMWALPLAFALLNAVVLVVHPGRTGAGFADMEKELDAETRALQALTEKERAVTAVLATARSSRAALAELYQDRFSTQAARLTRLISEVKRLAQLAGLEPASISYPEETLDEYGLVRMSLVFGVEGTYPQLRTLVNLLELSDLFLVLDRVGLRDSQSSVLGMSLEISTFFAREPATAAAVGEPLGVEPGAAGQVVARPDRAAPAAAAPEERSPRPRPGTTGDDDPALEPIERSPRS